MVLTCLVRFLHPHPHPRARLHLAYPKLFHEEKKNQIKKKEANEKVMRSRTDRCCRWAKYIVTVDDQVKAYIKRIMAQLNKWMTGGKISKLVIVITSKETGENVERWQFDVCSPPPFFSLAFLPPFFFLL